MVPGFEPTTVRTRVSSLNHQTRASALGTLGLVITVSRCINVQSSSGLAEGDTNHSPSNFEVKKSSITRSLFLPAIAIDPSPDRPLIICLILAPLNEKSGGHREEKFRPIKISEFSLLAKSLFAKGLTGKSLCLNRIFIMGCFLNRFVDAKSAKRHQTNRQWSNQLTQAMVKCDLEVKSQCLIDICCSQFNVGFIYVF